MKSGMRPDEVGFIVKVFGASTLIAIALKTLGPRLPIPATTVVSLVLILTPALLMGALLCWQLWTSRHDTSAHPGHH